MYLPALSALVGCACVGAGVEVASKYPVHENFKAELEISSRLVSRRRFLSCLRDRPALLSQRTLHREQLVACPFDNCAPYLCPVDPDSRPLSTPRGENLTDNLACPQYQQTLGRVSGGSLANAQCKF